MTSFLFVTTEHANLRDELCTAGFVPGLVDERRSPLGEIVRVLHVTWAADADAPSQIQIGALAFRRILDRFYVPYPPDPAAATALFDFVATTYDDLVDPRRNIANIRRLLAAVCKRIIRATSPLRILDFGCGTGLSFVAVSTASQVPALDFVGTDASSTMLEIARVRGLPVMSYDAWRKHPIRSFHAIIASYVLHCGVTTEEWLHLSQQLKDDGIVAANYHHADTACIEAVIAQADDVGLETEILADASVAWSRDPAMLFRPRR